MNRRTFLSCLGLAAPALGAGQVVAPAKPSRIESLTPGTAPAIALNHLGFQPKARKIVVYRQTGGAPPAEFVLRGVGHPVKPFRVTRPFTKVGGDLGDCLIGDFSDVQTEGLYEIDVGNERSVPFFVRPDVWRRTLAKAISYVHSQRCGIAVPNRHPACHLDDGRRRDTGEYVDVTGGWHSAGDVRKSCTTMMNAFGLLHLVRNLGAGWDPAGSGLDPLLNEIQWGNRYFLKMQDADGLVWKGVGGGVNGDNSDDHWTDNAVGTADDRHVDTAKSGMVQEMFITLQAMATQAFRETDPGYARLCLAAGTRCWNAARKVTKSAGDSHWWNFTTELSWRLLAAVEMYRATGQQVYRAAAAEVGQQLLSLQVPQFVGSQKMVRGFWRTAADDSTPSVDPVYSALPPLALLELFRVFPKDAGAGRWRDAVRMHLDECIAPLSARSAFRIVPYGVFLGSPTPEHYRPLAGGLTYRYFMPVRKQWWWLGLTSHLECYAVLLAMAAKTFGQGEYRDLACRQLEWVMGANPFGACLMTGEGARNPYAYNAFIGLIPGGIVNGIAGNVQDEPILDNEYGMAGDTWRTREYWSPQNAFYVWALSVLEST